MQSIRAAIYPVTLPARLAAMIVFASPVLAAPLDPNAFTSLGTLNLSSGSLTFNTTTLSVSGAFSGTGVLHTQAAGLPDIAVFTFDELAIETGVMLNLTGSRPIAILSKGNAMIDRTIHLNGFGAGGSIGGMAQLGGGAGGNGHGTTDPQNGSGPGGGSTSGFSANGGYGGGGGGFGGDGGNGGGPDLLDLAPGGTAYGDLAIALQGGSGGGGGIRLNTFSPNAGGGGGSGGAIEISALGTVYVAAVSSRGAPGADVSGNSGGGGGGSGGAVLLHGQTVTVAGEINADGGDGGRSSGTMQSSGGGGGGGGRILVQPEVLSLDNVPFSSVRGGQPGIDNAPVFPALSGESGIAILEPVTTIIPTGRLVQVHVDGALPSDTGEAPWHLQTDRLRFDAGSIGAALAPVASAHDIELNGGIVAAALGWTMTGAAQITGFGQLSGAVSGGTTNHVAASGGTLTLGDANSNTGFSLAGTVDIAAGATLNLLDADAAELGAEITLADGARLISYNGIQLGAGDIVTASAVAEIGGQFTNQGTVNGPTAVGEFLTFTDDVDGAGNYTGNVLFSDGFSPGSSAAAVSMQNVMLDSTAELRLEIGGLAAGGEHDQLNVSGTADLAGTLQVVLIDDFEPAAGDAFGLMNWGARVGTFDTVLLPPLGSGLSWNTSQLYTAGLVSVALPGDYNGDDTVDAADYVVWRKGVAVEPTEANYNIWRANFGRTAGGGARAESLNVGVPEPASVWLLFLVLGAVAACCRGRGIGRMSYLRA